MFVGIVTLPLLLNYVGAEGFGLIGVFTLLYSLSALLDMGLLPALSRDISRLRDLPAEHWRLRTLVNSVEIFFAGVAITIAITIVACSGWIASKWLTPDRLSTELVTHSLWIMAATLSIRWMAALNRSGIVAYEKQVWINCFDIAISTLRFPVSILVVMVTTGDLITYFTYQASVGALEFVGLRWKFHRLLPGTSGRTQWFSAAELKRILPFAGGIAYATIVWVLLTQLDKLILSRVLQLSEYGYFVLVVTITAGISMISTPISRAILPRMTSLVAAGSIAQMLEVYQSATRYVVCVATPVTLIMALWPHELIFAWSGERAAAEWASDILPLYAIGGGIISITSFQYFLQYAHGDLRLLTRFNTFALVLNVPLIIYAAFEYGAIGVARVWFAFRVLSFLIWVPIVHSRLAPGIHVRWMTLDVLPSFLACLIPILLAYFIYSPQGSSRIEVFVFFSLIVLVSLCVGLIVSSIVPGYRHHFAD